VIHGESDRIVEVEQARRLADAASAAGVPLTLRTVPGMGHDIYELHPAWPSVWRETIAFLSEALRLPDEATGEQTSASPTLRGDNIDAPASA